LPGMLARRAGKIAFVASLAGLVGAPCMVAYSTTKFALVGFAEALRLELAGTGITVTAVCPGYVRTNLSRATRYHDEAFRRFVDDAPSWYGMKAERVARALADGVAEGRSLIVMGPEKIGWWLKRVAPDAAFALARWVKERTGIGGLTDDARRGSSSPSSPTRSA